LQQAKVVYPLTCSKGYHGQYIQACSLQIAR
jgi:hypothetical protein